MRYFHTLTFRVLVGSCLLLICLFGFYSYFAVRFHAGQMDSHVRESADRVSNVIKNSTHYSMLLNRSEDVKEIITSIGREPGVEGIRIYNKRGTIMFSTNKSEEGTAVDMDAEACTVCHDRARPLQSVPTSMRARIYPTAQGYRVLGLINPIHNEPACSNAACHAHPADLTVLGVLDVRMSLQKIDTNIDQAQRILIIYAVIGTIVVALASGIFLFVTVHQPVGKLREGTKQLSAGHLDFRISLDSQDEIGQLARAFNEMAASWQKAEQENRIWSQTLESRVEEKTAELKRIHEQILQIEKMASLGKLSATVAHELNNPLEGILNYAKLISRRLKKADPSQAMQPILEDLDLIISEIQRCGDIVKNMLLFSRQQIGEFELAPVAGIVDRAMRLMQHHFKTRKISFQSEIADPAIALRCDETQIHQALIALFVNAVEAMPDGGDLKLAVVRDASGGIRMEITDTGSGIGAEDIPHLFEPFFTTKRMGKGVGLGLSVVYGIVQRHEGSVSVRSELGKGTSFTLVFPPTALHRRGVDSKGTMA